MSSDKGQIIKCLDHSQRVSKKLLSFYENKQFIDIILVSGVDNFELQAHRIVLSTLSEFFLRMFNSQLQEATADKIHLKDIDSVTIKNIIDFMYTGEIELHCDTIESIFTAASFLQMDTLISACCDFMMEQIDVSNCLGISLLAEQYNYPDLYKRAIRFAYTHFEEVCAEKEFLQLNAEQLGNYLSSDKLCTDSEEQVFRSLVTWLQYDEENRCKFAASLLRHVRIALLDLHKNMHLECRTLELREQISSWLSLASESYSQISTENTKLRRPRQTLVVVCGISTDNLMVSMLNQHLMTWTAKKMSTPLLARESYSAIFINKKMIIAGGEIHGVLTNRLECFDLDTKQWTDLPSMGIARKRCKLAELFGDLYVVGGCTGLEWSNSVEKYDFLTKKWQFVASLNTSFAWIKTSVSDDGFLYAAGFNSHRMEVYNNIEDKWTFTANKKELLKDFGMTAAGEYVYAFGGRDNNNTVSNTVERYHKETDTWTLVSPLNNASSSMKCATLKNRPIIAGGYNGSSYNNVVEEYDPEKQECTLLAYLPAGYQAYFEILIS